MIHKHVWKVISRQEQPSAYEIMQKNPSLGLRLVRQSDYVRPVIVTQRCVKCPAERVRRV